MDRSDLRRAKTMLPQLEDIWCARVHHLEDERVEARRHLHSHIKGRESKIAADLLYHRIDRLARSMAFLDRALIHLDDLKHGTSAAEAVHRIRLEGSRA